MEPLSGEPSDDILLDERVCWADVVDTVVPLGDGMACRVPRLHLSPHAQVLSSVDGGSPLLRVEVLH